MRYLDIDVIGRFAPKDKAMKAFSTALEFEHRKFKAPVKFAAGSTLSRVLISDVKDVFAFVDKVNAELARRGPGTVIRRLRLFGHGSSNLFVFSPLTITLDDLSAKKGKPKIQAEDLSKVLWYIENFEKGLGGKIVKKGGSILSASYLNKLNGKFSTGWVELHSCRITSDQGKGLIQGLARLFGVPVAASEVKQVPYGGLEGPVWVAQPNGKVYRKGSAAIPTVGTGTTLATQTGQAGTGTGLLRTQSLPGTRVAGTMVPGNYQNRFGVPPVKPIIPRPIIPVATGRSAADLNRERAMRDQRIRDAQQQQDAIRKAAQQRMEEAANKRRKASFDQQARDLAKRQAAIEQARRAGLPMAGTAKRIWLKPKGGPIPTQHDMSMTYGQMYSGKPGARKLIGQTHTDKWKSVW